jgi:hypothetical protein
VDRAALDRIEVARQAFKAIEQRHSHGIPVSDEDYHKWSLRLLEAKRATSQTNAEEIAAMQAHCDRMKELRERALKLYQNGQMDMLQYLDTVYWSTEATGWLQKARKEASDPTR